MLKLESNLLILILKLTSSYVSKQRTLLFEPPHDEEIRASSLILRKLALYKLPSKRIGLPSRRRFCHSRGVRLIDSLRSCARDRELKL